jgi:hypothetical protein
MSTLHMPDFSSLVLPIYEEFNLKSDDPTINQGTEVTIDDAKGTKPVGTKPKQGRLYSKEYSLKPSGIKVEDMIYGLKMAHISCTDDSDTRLEGSGANTIKALEEIVGQDNVGKPLTTLLKENFDLTMDCWINESGVRKFRPVDTQAFIASNESTIVLSYRFSTSGLDWMTNLSLTSSEWEPDKDAIIGHAGWCSCLDGCYTKCFTKRGKARVHTGFYNNFIYSLPFIRKHILEPLLKSDATPKKVYICGCSLGAALATLAFCYVLEEMLPSLENPNFVPHKLFSVTAGSPRVCDEQMRDEVMEKVKKLRDLDRAVICRLVYHQDLVPHIPFHISGFVHLEKLVYITVDGDVIINPRLKKSKNFAEIRTVWNAFRDKDEQKKTTLERINGTNSNNNTPAAMQGTTKNSETTEESIDNNKKEKTAFEIECEKTPEPIKCHMPYWYLTYLARLKEKEDAGEV